MTTPEGESFPEPRSVEGSGVDGESTPRQSDLSVLAVVVHGPHLVELHGEIDYSNIGQLTAVLDGVDRPPSGLLVVDCVHVTFLDHRTVTALADWASRHDCLVEMVGTAQIAERLIEILGVDNVRRRSDA